MAKKKTEVKVVEKKDDSISKLTQKVNELDVRISRIVNAISKAKSVKGL